MRYPCKDLGGSRWGRANHISSVDEAGSYLRLTDFVYHSTRGLRVIKSRRRWWKANHISAVDVAEPEAETRRSCLVANRAPSRKSGHPPPGMWPIRVNGPQRLNQRGFLFYPCKGLGGSRWGRVNHISAVDVAEPEAETCLSHPRHPRLIDSGITQLKAQGPSRTCNESKEEEEDGGRRITSRR